MDLAVLEQQQQLIVRCDIGGNNFTSMIPLLNWPQYLGLYGGTSKMSHFDKRAHRFGAQFQSVEGATEKELLFQVPQGLGGGGQGQRDL